MKLLTILAVLCLGVWLWRAQRRPTIKDQTPEPGPTQSEQAPHEMVACRACAVHIPAGEAHVGRLGSYCSADHLKRSES